MGRRLVANTVLVEPGSTEPTVLFAGDEVPGWAEGLVGDHLTGGGFKSADDDAPDVSAGSGATPDESWTLEELREYAKANGVDLHGATKKADVLDAVRGA